MAYNTKTVDHIKDLVKLIPEDLKVMILHDGLCYPIYKIKTCYVIPTEDWGKNKCYVETDEDTKGAIQILLIE